jgi:hypothetical protein
MSQKPKTFKADVSVFPVGSIYYGKKVIYNRIDGSGILKKTSNILPTSYVNENINKDNDYVNISLEGGVITEPRQLKHFELTPSFKFNDHKDLDTLIIVCNLTGEYVDDCSETKYYFFYEIEYMYSKGIITKRSENYTNTQPNIIQKLYNFNINLLPNSSLDFSIVNLSNNTISWHLKTRFS